MKAYSLLLLCSTPHEQIPVLAYSYKHSPQKQFPKLSVNVLFSSKLIKGKPQKSEKSRTKTWCSVLILFTKEITDQRTTYFIGSHRRWDLGASIKQELQHWMKHFLKIIQKNLEIEQ